MPVQPATPDGAEQYILCGQFLPAGGTSLTLFLNSETISTLATPADEVHYLDAVAVIDDRLVPLLTTNNPLVDLDGDSLGRE